MAKKIGELYWEITAQTGKFEKGLTDSKSRMAQFRSGVNDVVQGLTGFNVSTLSAVGAVVAVGNAVKQGIQEWQNYALSSKDASSALGVTVEDFTRLVQVADDARLSQEQLTTALQMMAKNGVAPSIENLAKLADELKGMSVTDRAAKLSELFGRNWREVYKILDKGGAALKANTEAVAAGLVVTGQAADAAEDYYLALDELNDSVTELKNSGLKELIPLLTGIIETTNGVTRANKEADSWWVKLAYSVPTLGLVLAALDGEFYKTRDANQAALDTARQMPDTMAQMAGSITTTKDAVQSAKDVTASWGARYQAEADKIKAANAEMITQLNDELTGAFKNAQDASANWAKGAGGDIITQLDDAGLSAGELSQAFMAVDDSLGTNEFWTRKQKDATKLLVDQYKRTGDIDAFKEGLLRLKNGGFQALDHDVVVAREHIREVFADLDKYNGKSFTVYFNVEGNTGGGGGGGTTYTRDTGTSNPGNLPGFGGLATGGTAYADTPYIVGEKGPEVFVPNKTGTVVPNDELPGLAPITLNFYGVTDPKKLAEIVTTELRRARRN